MINMNTTIIGDNMVGITLTIWEDQWVMGIDHSFVRVLLMLNMEQCFISGILVAIACKSRSLRFEMFRYCIKLKLSILVYDLLNPNLFSDAFILESTLSWLLDGKTNVIAFASHPSGRYIISYGNHSASQ